MAIDYDKIKDGRRRDWESLKPDDIRQKEREDERERAKKEREEKGIESYQTLRQRLKDEAAEADRAKFRKTMRQTILGAGVFLLICGCWLGITRLIENQRAAALKKSMQQAQVFVDEGKIIHDQKTAVGAFASWRSAWKRGEMAMVVRLFSDRFLSRSSENKNPGDILGEFERLYRTGRLEPNRKIAASFDGAEVIRIPRPPYRNEELALFRSPMVQPPGKFAQPIQYIAAFSYNRNRQTWHFADVREEKYFSVKWTTEPMIRPMRVGPGAMTFNRQGDALQKEAPLPSTALPSYPAPKPRQNNQNTNRDLRRSQ